ncbi:MAG: TlpA disulfide reductase family protein [Bacteroidota bacterium]|nr:TlpA disulfide reductase family protein [Bacteroidota bacterium]MDP4230998.1 TlpA disulfide reductase family protein [Bacteroidota bacterium]MDP4237466.1 TlpA disulfide reductase family protein [Bacteroidota bacterium]
MRLLLSILCVLLIHVGCAPTPTDTPTGNTPDTLRFQGNISTLYGSGSKIAPDGSGQIFASNIIWKDSLGVIQSLDSLRGKIVLLNFWAIWCVPCEAELPGLESISETMGPDIVVIGVSALDPESSLFDRTKLYAQTRNMKYQIITDQGSKAYQNYDGNGTVPRSFAIDRDGRIVHTFVGQQSKQQFMDILNQIP